MSISYQGIGEWCATFGCGAVKEGEIVKVSVNGAVVLDEDEKALHDLWEATSFELDKLQWIKEGCL